MRAGGGASSTRALWCAHAAVQRLAILRGRKLVATRPVGELQVATRVLVSQCLARQPERGAWCVRVLVPRWARVHHMDAAATTVLLLGITVCFLGLVVFIVRYRRRRVQLSEG